MFRASYRNITIFTNRIRVSKLNAFRQSLSGYFDDTTAIPMAGGRSEGENAKQLRPNINQKIPELRAIIRAAGIGTGAQSLPAPIVGGWRMPFDFISDVFRLHDFEAPPRNVFDLIDRAIGVYDADKVTAMIRTINPIWWLGRLLRIIGRLPFTALAAAGFETSDIESSFLGKIIKLTAWLLGLVASILTVYAVYGK